MKNEIMDSVGRMDDDMIERVDELRRSGKKRFGSAWVRWAAAAACFCLLAAGAYGAGVLFRNRNEADNGTEIQQGAVSTEIGTSEADTQKNGGNGLEIPAIALPEATNGEQNDMQPLVVYQGGVYLFSEAYQDADAEKIEPLIGEYLGEAKGTIDEWSKQDEYAVEFASTINGKVYAVKGYDTDFRICMMGNEEYDDGEIKSWIYFLDRLNGITVKTGTDVFEKRLHLRDRIEKIRYQSHEDWNSGNEKMIEADISPKLLEAFLNEIDSGEFVCTKALYDTSGQVHIYLNQTDGTVIRLRLIEGGYVGYNAMPFCFVQIPGETFDAVFAACGGKTE